MAVGDDLIDYIQGKIYQYLAITRPDQFEMFFKDGLYFSRDDARRVAYCYLAACDVFEVTPGLGSPKANARTKAKPVDLQGEFTKLGLGKFSTGLVSTKLDLRLSDYFAGHPTAAAAKKALTPAKRDALKAEADKLIKVPTEAWKRYYEKTTLATVGVRG